MLNNSKKTRKVMLTHVVADAKGCGSMFARLYG